MNNKNTHEKTVRDIEKIRSKTILLSQNLEKQKLNDNDDILDLFEDEADDQELSSEIQKISSDYEYSSSSEDYEPSAYEFYTTEGDYEPSDATEYAIPGYNFEDDSDIHFTPANSEQFDYGTLASVDLADFDTLDEGSGMYDAQILEELKRINTKINPPVINFNCTGNQGGNPISHTSGDTSAYMHHLPPRHVHFASDEGVNNSGPRDAPPPPPPIKPPSEKEIKIAQNKMAMMSELMGALAKKREKLQENEHSHESSRGNGFRYKKRRRY